MELLKGKTAIITGCNRGIGRATLEKFCAYGADVFALVRQESESFLQDIEKLKASVLACFNNIIKVKKSL